MPWHSIPACAGAQWGTAVRHGQTPPQLPDAAWGTQSRGRAAPCPRGSEGRWYLVTPCRGQPWPCHPHQCRARHQPGAAETFSYPQHQVFSAVITTAIIISFGVFSCHNLSLALIYSAGLFQSRAGGTGPSQRRQGGSGNFLIWSRDTPKGSAASSLP